MAHTIIVAEFAAVKGAKEAVSELRKKGFMATLDLAGGDLPDPDRSVSALMVGFLPDLAHGLFANDAENHDKQINAYLVAVVDEHDDQEYLGNIVSRYGGSIIDREKQ